MSRNLRRGAMVGAALPVAGLVGVATAQAATSGNGQEFHACVAGYYHTLNLVGPDATCPQGQRKIEFSREGPAGPRGDRGRRD